MSSGQSCSDNWRRAKSFINEAASNGAKWVVLPEMFLYIGSYNKYVDVAKAMVPDVIEELKKISKQLKINIFAGSVPEVCVTEFCSHQETVATEQQHIFNTMYTFSSQGKVVSKYRKLHLFHYETDCGQVTHSEAQVFSSGDEICHQPFDGWHVGMGICYDLRFSQMFASMAARIPLDCLIIPAAFTQETGKDHWELLVRARAVENQCYVIAPNQSGDHGEGKVSYGHSIICDPWGEIVASTGNKTGIAYETIELERIRSIRRRLPCYKHRRPDCYVHAEK